MASGVARRLRARERERGAAAVEFALVAPILLLLVFGIISYGLMLNLRQAISQAASEGARAGAVTLVEADKESAALAAVNESLSSVGVSCDAGVLERAGQAAGTCAVSSAEPCETSVPTPQCITVTISYDYATNPLTPELPGLGLVMPDTLEYVAVARIN